MKSLWEFCTNLIKVRAAPPAPKEEPRVIQHPKRISLVPASGVTSYYKKKSNPSERWDISVFKEGALVPPDMLFALIELNDAVTEQQGKLYITDLTRTWALQQKRREDYLNKTKPAYAAPPGGSWHQAGRAIDISTQELGFVGVPKENWLKKFWSIATPLGFYPIIKTPDLSKSECWHFDFPGKDWENAYDYADNFSNDSVDNGLVAKCAILDIGAWDPNENPYKVTRMFIQAQLIRLGRYEIGSIDGVLGTKTQKALADLGLGGLGLEEIASELSKK